MDPAQGNLQSELKAEGQRMSRGSHETAMDLFFRNRTREDEGFTILGAVGRFLIAFIAAGLIGAVVTLFGIPASPSGGARSPDAGQGEGLLLALYLGIYIVGAPILGLAHQTVSLWLFRRGAYGLVTAGALGAVLFAVATVPFLNVAESGRPVVILGVAGATFGIPLGIANWMMMSVGKPAVAPAGFAGIALAAWVAWLIQPLFWEALATGN